MLFYKTTQLRYSGHTFKPQKKVTTVTQTTQSPNMTGHTQTGHAAKNFQAKQQRLAEDSNEPVMLSGAEMLVQALTDEGVE